MNADVLICGGEADQSLGNAIAKNFNSTKIHDVTGRLPLMTQAALIKLSDVAVANDSGLMHVAYATDTPVIAIFGPTRPSATGPVGEKHIVLHNPPKCAPCKLKPCSVDNVCMYGVETRDVLSAISKIINSSVHKHYRRDNSNEREF